MMWKQTYPDAGRLLLRVGAALLLCFGHGVQKYTTLQTNPEAFPDPMGIGHSLSLVLAMGAECGASMLVALGLYTRLSCLPILFTMGMVAVVVHKNDPWSQTEPSVIFFVMFLTVLLLGPGRYAIDALRRKGR